MKAILEFDLPEDQPEYDALMKARTRADRMDAALAAINQIARTELKRGLNTTCSLTKALEAVRSITMEDGEDE